MLPITTLTGLVSAPSRAMNGLRLRLADITDALRDTDVLQDTGDRRTGRTVWARAGRARRASTMGLAALVGTQLGQTYLTDWHSPLVLITSVASAATLFAIVETPVVSHFFGCTPLGPVAWSIVVGCSAAATVGAAVAPRLLFPGGCRSRSEDATR
ncbi:cation transporting ATPase C-terminal domain-containing protein [Streptomyces iranensis]|uniref:ATPase, P-type (Transporting), HAD superfamily,subfamily IC n=1 Tax=Streptomyces iranensis TaxID=576784 RepID=A0A060ZEM4_9ACTN|nr:cation transporting ATPase C-terminal domain-containing protein [Streptomyces iranensis]MBP2061987.1 hypothetical protein [Streptomyces iranensis]CDR03883.1 ATPase, P-type (transporting), HAD superfamily,subfamily IC [Streptomyces iranensis]